MGFVDHEGLRAGQDLTEAFLLERQVGQQQVVVDHHDIGRLRPLPRLHHEAFVEERALAAQAVLGGRGDHGQQRGILGQRVQLCHVAQLGASGPGDHALELRGLLAGGMHATAQLRLAAGLVQPVLAQVVGPALEQCRLQPGTQGVAHARQVAVVELVLQRTGAGGDDGLHPRQQRRHQVGKGLAGAGAGLGQQHLAAFERFGDGSGQALLGLARDEVLQLAGKRAIDAEGVAAGMGKSGHRYILMKPGTVQA